MSSLINKTEPYVLLLDTENVDLLSIKKAEKEVQDRCLFIKERRAYERSNQRIGGEKRETLLSMGYTFVDIGETTQKDAVDTAIKADMWHYVDRYQKRMVLVSRDGGFSQIIEDIKRQGVKMVVPKLRQTSKKLKPFSGVGHLSMSQLTKMREEMSDRSSIALEVEKLKEKIGKNPEKALSEMASKEERDLMWGLMKAIKKNPAVYVNHWIYTRHIELIAGKKWAKVITDHIRRNADHYDMVVSSKSCQKYPIMTHRMLAQSFGDMHESEARKAVFKNLAKKASKFVPAVKKGKVREPVNQILEELVRINEAFKVFCALSNGRSHAAEVLIAYLENQGLLKRQ